MANVDNGTTANATADSANYTIDAYEAFVYPDLSQINAVCIAFIVFYLAVMVIALFGNAAVVWTVMSNRKMQTVVNYYIVNLAVCDFLIGAFVLPVKLIELTAPAHWNLLNDLMCTSSLFLQMTFVFASIFTLVATCIERYFAIVHPLESKIHQSKSRTIKIVVLVWILPLLVSLPNLIWPYKVSEITLSSDYGTIARRYCKASFEGPFRVGYFTFLFVFFYFIPLTFIGFTCLRITISLLKSTSMCRESSLRRQEANRRKVAKMVLVVVAAFAISWTPYFLITMVTTHQEHSYFQDHNFFFTMLCINLFGFLNSAINPFIYATMSTRFRNGFSILIRFMLCASRPVEELASEHEDNIGRSRRNPFAAFHKYHRQMVLLACGEPTQISTDSLAESQHTVTASLAANNFTNQINPRLLRRQSATHHNHSSATAYHHRHSGHLHLNPINCKEVSRSLTAFEQRQPAVMGNCSEANTSPDAGDSSRLWDQSSNLSRARSESCLLRPSDRHPHVLFADKLDVDTDIIAAECGGFDVEATSGSVSLEELNCCQHINGEVIVHQRADVSTGDEADEAMEMECAPLNCKFKQQSSLESEIEYIDSEL